MDYSNAKQDDFLLVSIIMPTFNRGHVLKKAILSILDQTYENWELIIVDDASSDDTAILVNEYKDSRIKYIYNQKNQGANYCRNVGAKNAKGKYLAFLDSDNYWENNKLEMQLREIAGTQEDVGFVFCRQIVYEDGKTEMIPEEDRLEHDLGQIMYWRNIVDTNTVLMKRECFEKAGGFDEKMPRIQDWEFFFRVLNICHYKALYLPVCLNHNVIQNDSISKNNQKYVDAIFYFMDKYRKHFYEAGVIPVHILSAFSSKGVEKEDVCKKVCAYFIDDSKMMEDVLYSLSSVLEKNRKFYRFIYEWKLKEAKRNGRSIFTELLGDDNKKIAIYGLGRWGELLYQDIKRLPVEIVYGIDRKANEFHSLQIKRPDATLTKVDLLIVTVFWEFEDIKAKLQENYTGKIVSLEELIHLVC